MPYEWFVIVGACIARPRATNGRTYDGKFGAMQNLKQIDKPEFDAIFNKEKP